MFSKKHTSAQYLCCPSTKEMVYIGIWESTEHRFLLTSNFTTAIETFLSNNRLFLLTCLSGEEIIKDADVYGEWRIYNAEGVLDQWQSLSKKSQETNT